MNHLVINLAIVLLAALTTVSAKCDIMKEFKPEVEAIGAWAKKKCDTNKVLTDADMAKAKKCYDDNVAQLIGASKHADTINKFLNGKIFGNADMKKVCTDKKVQDDVKKSAMKDIGMKKGMECKKEIEADCPKFKAGLKAFTDCAQS